jgi:hypothetical protein
MMAVAVILRLDAFRVLERPQFAKPPWFKDDDALGNGDLEIVE